MTTKCSCATTCSRKKGAGFCPCKAARSACISACSCEKKKACRNQITISTSTQPAASVSNNQCPTLQDEAQQLEEFIATLKF
uniref:Uncharacterized protein n=1 Tax=Amphimedon queenslandica TaxID=400682 RepID=A0A1X7VD86_AMPQE